MLKLWNNSKHYSERNQTNKRKNNNKTKLARKSRKNSIRALCNDVRCMHMMFRRELENIYLYTLIHVIDDANNTSSTWFDRRRWRYISINNWCVSANSFAAPASMARVIPHGFQRVGVFIGIPSCTEKITHTNIYCVYRLNLF